MSDGKSSDQTPRTLGGAKPSGDIPCGWCEMSGERYTQAKHLPSTLT